MDDVERACRVYLEHFDVNPDKWTAGLGARMPAGHRYQLWEYQREAMEKVVAALVKLQEEPAPKNIS